MIRVPIVGKQFRPIAAQVRAAELKDGEPLNLVPEPDNKFDPNAIQVVTEDGVFVGYIPAKKCEEVFTLWRDDGEIYVTFRGGKVEIIGKAEADADAE